MLPILISVSVTPGPYILAAQAVPAPSAKATAAAGDEQLTVELHVLLLFSYGGGCFGRRDARAAAGPAPSCEPSIQQSDKSPNPGRHEIHEKDQEHAVDRPGRGLGDLLGEVGDEHDDQAAEDRTGDRRESPDHDSDQEGDREEEVERVGRDELDRDRAERPATPVYSALTPNVSDLYERGVDAHRAGRDRVVADRLDRAPGAPAQQVPGAHEKHQHHGEREVVQPTVLRDGQAERRVGLGDRHALHAAGPGARMRRT